MEKIRNKRRMSETSGKDGGGGREKKYYSE